MEEADQLVDDLLAGEVQLAFDRGKPDLGDGARKRVGAQAEQGVNHLVVGDGGGEPQLNGAAGEPGAPSRQR